MQHLHSFVYESKVGLPRIIRTGWMTFDKPYFIWRSYFRLSDLLNLWFECHHFPHQYWTSNICVLLFQAAFQRLYHILHTHQRDTPIATPYEQQCLQNVPVSQNVDGTLLVDEATMTFVIKIMETIPLAIFAEFDQSQYNPYNQSSHRLCLSIAKILSQEDTQLSKDIDEGYRLMTEPPLCYQIASILVSLPDPVSKVK